MDRQKMLMIFAGSGIAAALLVFLLYRTTQAPKVQETVTVQAAAHDMPAGTKLKKEDIKTKQHSRTLVDPRAYVKIKSAFRVFFCFDFEILYPYIGCNVSCYRRWCK